MKTPKQAYSGEWHHGIPVRPMPMEGLIRLETVLAHYQVSRAQLYQEILEGTFPRQIKIGRSSFWDAVEVRTFLRNAGATITLPQKS